MKLCSICNREKAPSEYYATREGTVYGPCKECRRESANARHEERRQQARLNFNRLADQA
jgi:hypothetical protein